MQLILLLLSRRYNDGRRPGYGERAPLPALPSTQLFGHSLQRDQTGTDRYEHSFHPAQCGHQDQGNLLAWHALLFVVNCKLVFVLLCIFLILF